ncbi:DUF2322 family protein [Simonsiella muelleri]|uniref:DUF2322 family protein n=1 Tax=Simonsiella muelleri TaxID=72 RepID=UPI0028D5BD2A|nr:DUF2322 family protein [Simonsiella muelleri]
MNFQDYLNTFPSIDHLSRLDVCDEQGNVIHTIPAVAGKLGSLKLYYALARQFDGKLNAQSATQGIEWFAEHVADAQANLGKHPNIDLLLHVQQQGLNYRLVPHS